LNLILADGGFWERATNFLKEESAASGEITFYDSNTGKPLFWGPRDRSWDEFVKESKVHGWPSFRDSEVNWDVRSHRDPNPRRPRRRRTPCAIACSQPEFDAYSTSVCCPMASASPWTAPTSATICPIARATATASTS
jgi:hypothetical protein